MPKIKCGAFDCIYNDDNLYCTAKEIRLNEHYVMTVWEGRQHFWSCNLYEMNEISKRMLKQFEKIMEKEKK